MYGMGGISMHIATMKVMGAQHVVAAVNDTFILSEAN